MYETWHQERTAGREPCGADLARAAGRDNDATGVGCRAGWRYRDAHESQCRGGNADKDAQAAAGPPPLALTTPRNGHKTPAGGTE